MKKTLLFACIFCLSASTLTAQTVDTIRPEIVTPPPPEKEDGADVHIFTKVEQEASFPGGNKAWLAFLSAKLRGFDPAGNGAPKGRYTVIAKFVVNKTGQISDISTETVHGYGMEKAVLKMIQQSPNWLPAMQNGRTVNAYRRQPVTFVVE